MVCESLSEGLVVVFSSAIVATKSFDLESGVLSFNKGNRFFEGLCAVLSVFVV